jgi:hypothetical protein
MLWFFNSHTYLLSSVAFRLSKKLNDALWFASLFLNEFSVSPTYVWGSQFVVLSLIVTVIYSMVVGSILRESQPKILAYRGYLKTTCKYHRV